MLKAIIHNSPALITFILAMQLALSKPQRRHVLNVVDGLIVGEGRKPIDIKLRQAAGRGIVTGHAKHPERIPCPSRSVAQKRNGSSIFLNSKQKRQDG
jgi:hypothetical protein